MTADERSLLILTAKQQIELFSNRDDMLVGITAVLLDLYRTLIRAGLDDKQSAATRLKIQREILDQERQKLGVKFLDWMIVSLETDKLDAARLLYQSPAGNA